MSHSEKCPICLGDGVIEKEGLHKKLVEVKCHGCDGKGWITIHDKVDYQPIYPQPNPFDIPTTFPFGPVTWSGTTGTNTALTGDENSISFSGNDAGNEFTIRFQTDTSGNTLDWSGTCDFTEDEKKKYK